MGELSTDAADARSGAYAPRSARPRFGGSLAQWHPDHPSLMAFAVCLAAALFVLWPMLGAPFGPNDDYQLADMIGPDHELALGDVPGLATMLTGQDVGRFRPAYYPMRTLEAALFDENTTAWHVARLVLLLIGTASLIALLRGVVPAVGLIILPLLLVAGPQAEVWIWLGPNEAYGIPLLLGGLALWRYGFRWPAVALLLVAGLTKESFAIFNVGVAAWLVWRQWSPATAAFVVGTVLSLVGVGVTYLEGEALYSAGRTPELVRMTFATFVWHTGMGALVAAALVPTRRVLWTAVGAMLLLAPQAYITGASGTLLPGRYLLPGALAFLLLGAAVLGSRPSWRRSLAAVVITASMAFGLASARVMADDRAADAHRLEVAVERIAVYRAEHPDRQIVFAPNRGRWEYEWYAALSIFVRFAGVALEPAVTVIPAEPPLSEFELVLENWIAGYAPAGHPTQPCLSVQAAGSPPVCDEVLSFVFP